MALTGRPRKEMTADDGRGHRPRATRCATTRSGAHSLAGAPHSRSGSARGARSVWQRPQSRKRAGETYGVRLLGALLYGESRETHVCSMLDALSESGAPDRRLWHLMARMPARMGCERGALSTASERKYSQHMYEVASLTSFITQHLKSCTHSIFSSVCIRLPSRSVAFRAATKYMQSYLHAQYRGPALDPGVGVIPKLTSRLGTISPSPGQSPFKSRPPSSLKHSHSADQLMVHEDDHLPADLRHGIWSAFNVRSETWGSSSLLKVARECVGASTRRPCPRALSCACCF